MPDRIPWSCIEDVPEFLCGLGANAIIASVDGQCDPDLDDRCYGAGLYDLYCNVLAGRQVCTVRGISQLDQLTQDRHNSCDNYDEECEEIHGWVDPSLDSLFMPQYFMLC